MVMTPNNYSVVIQERATIYNIYVALDKVAQLATAIVSLHLLKEKHGDNTRLLDLTSVWQLPTH